MVPKVVVVGAGFGGIEVARHLADRPVDITLVDRNNFHTFQPLLYQVATAGLNAADVAHVVRGLFHGQRNLRFRQATVTGVDWAARTVLLDGQPPLPFDHLVLAGGAAVTHFGTPGAAEHGFALYTLADAVKLRNHVVERFEAAADRRGRRRAAARTAASPSWWWAAARPAWRPPARWPSCSRWCSARTTRSSTSAGPASCWWSCRTTCSGRSRHAAGATRSTRCASRGVEVRLGTAVAEVAADAVTFADGEVLPSHTLVWAAGVRANPLADRAGPRAGPRRAHRGRTRTSACRAATGVWAIGDIAAATDAKGDAPAAAGAGGHAGRAGTSPGRSGGWPRASPPSRSATGTRARWRPSAAGRRWPSCPAASTSAADWPGWPGSGCTSCSWWASATAPRCSSTGRGTTSPGTAAPGCSCAPDADPST